MKHYAGLDLSMESTQVCIIDENGRKLSSETAESTPDAIADALRRHGPIERAVIETGRMSPAICLGLGDIYLAHTSSESFPIADLVACAQALAVTALRFCGEAS